MGSERLHLRQAYEVLGALEQAFTVPDTESASLGSVWKDIQQLYASAPLSHIEFTSNVQTLPKHLQGLFYGAREAFTIKDRSIEEIEDKLNEFITRVNTHKAWFDLDEAKLFRHSAERWLTFIKSVDNFEPILHVDMFVPLKLNDFPITSSTDSLINDNDECITEFSFLIFYWGEQQTTKVDYIISVEENSDIVTSDVQNMPSFLERGQVGLGTLRIQYRESIKIQVKVNSDDIQLSQELELSLIRPNNEHSVSAGVNDCYLINPFSPSRPLVSKDEHKILFVGRAADIFKDILPGTDVPRRLHIIQGITGTGKTSLLYRLKRSIELRDMGVAVYLDLFGWYLSLKDHDIELNAENMWYELLNKTLFVTKINELIPDTEFQSLKDRFLPASIMQAKKVTPIYFLEFINEFYKKLKKPVVFLIDEFAYLGSRGIYDEAVINSFFYLLSGQNASVDLGMKRIGDLLDSAPCSFVLALDWTVRDANSIEDWEERYLRLNLNPLEHYICFLEREDMKELFSLIINVGSEHTQVKTVKLAFTDLAKTYIWQITGGWQSLTQALLYQIVEDINEKLTKKGQHQLLIRSDDIQQAVNNLLKGTTLIKRLTQHLVRNELVALACIQESLEPERLRINPFDIQKTSVGFQIKRPFMEDNESIQDGLEKLFQKQIIELVYGTSGALRLRVGILKYWEAKALLEK